MSNVQPIRYDSEISRLSLLAESVAAGLHSLAQPLTVAQWQLEIATMNASSSSQHEHQFAEALLAIEKVTARLDFLRDIIRPFRTGTEFKSESVRQAMIQGTHEQQDAFKNEGTQIVFRDGCAEGNVSAPQGFLHQISFYLLTLLRSLAPLSVTFDVSESGQSVLLLASQTYAAKQQAQVIDMHAVTTLRTYMEVLSGDLLMAQDFSFIRLSFPKSSGRL
jgi:hypothetical protein